MNVSLSTSASAPDAPDLPISTPSAAPASGTLAFSNALSGAYGDASAKLARADAAESAFATGKGGMQEMVLERARADIALSIASAAASRAAQSLTTILSMQV